MISLDDLRAICPQTKPARLALFLDSLNVAMDDYDISDNAEREAAFLAQVAHESGQFFYTREIWGPTPAQLRYEGRHDLGNDQPGDGKRFLGRGLIQITGRANYRACGAALTLMLETSPELLEQPAAACRSAGWWWKAHGCNEIADSGDFKAVTRRVNGGYNGLADRIAFHERAQQVLA